MNTSSSRPHANGAPPARTTGPDGTPDTGVLSEDRRPLRVLFINDTSRNGGPGRTLFYILKFLDPAVIHRSVVLPREGVVSDLLREGGVTDELLFETNFVENAVEPWRRPMVRDDFDAPLALRGVRAVGNVARGTAAMLSLARLVKRGRYDLIFCNGTSANFAGGALAAMTGVPAMWHVFYTSVGRPITRLHERLAAGDGVRAIVCVSRPTSVMFAHCMEKVRVIHDAIDVEEFDAAAVAPCLRAELGLTSRPDTVIFGSQGRILPRKGYIEMVRAARVAVDAMTEAERARCRFVVLGDTPEDIRPNHLEECRALVKELHLEGTFHFLGYRPDVKPYVGDFDVAVVPSVYEDPLPRAVMESMALRKPVVAFDVGGIGEMIEHGVTGALVRGSPPDVDALGGWMLTYLRDADLRRRHGEASRARVEREFEARVHARALQDEMVRVARR
jgi:glycosyltransferase involved in cell wall biosynthesis